MVKRLLCCLLIVTGVLGTIAWGLGAADVLASPFASGSTTWTVCATTCNFMTIQAAATSTSTMAGDSLLLLDPVHTQASIFIDKDLIIEGQGQSATILQAAASQAATTDRVLFIGSGAAACGVTGGANGSITGAFPWLSVLRDNGGPTQTYDLLPNSPAMEAGSTAVCLLTDQRGISRPLNAKCDVGAVERVFAIGAPLPNLPFTQLQLSWANAGLDSYAIWQSTQPYDGFALKVDVGAVLSYTEPISTTNLYYQIQGDQGGDTLWKSQNIGAFNFTLSPGE